jgi:DUF4097 and DUF4098 domain-containing protein YvlB
MASLLLLAGFGRTTATIRNETIEREFVISRPEAVFTLIVDNIWGSITVKGVPGKSVKVTIHKTIEARSDEQMQRALDEVSLDISHEDSLLEFYVDGPFRDRYPKRKNRHWHERKYKVNYEFELEIPRSISVDISTVNDGDILIENVWGDYHVNNVNGGIKMTGLRGSGKAYALNKDLLCYFDQNPKQKCTFGSLNGDVKLYFQEPLSAEFAMKTFNGEAYSDFKLTHVPSDPEIVREHNGRTVYKCVRRYHARAGHHGPVIELDGFNGDLLILKHRKGA